MMPQADVCIAAASIGSMLLVRPAAPQSGRFWQNPLPLGNRLDDVAVLANTVVAVGWGGTIVRTMALKRAV